MEPFVAVFHIPDYRGIITQSLIREIEFDPSSDSAEYISSTLDLLRSLRRQFPSIDVSGLFATEDESNALTADAILEVVGQFKVNDGNNFVQRYGLNGSYSQGTEKRSLDEIANRFERRSLRLWYGSADDVPRKARKKFKEYTLLFLDLGKDQISQRSFYLESDLAPALAKLVTEEPFGQWEPVGLFPSDMLAVVSSSEFKSSPLYSQLSLSLSLLSAYYHLGSTYQRQGAYQEAINAWSTGLALCADIPAAGYNIAFYKGLATLYTEMGDFRRALENTVRYNKLADSIANLQSAQAIDELQIQYETARSEQMIREQQLELARQRKAQQVTILIALLAGALAFSVIIALRSRLKLQRLRNDQRERDHEMELERIRQQSQLDALHAMIQGQEEERKRIAFDLHDQLGGLLTTIKLNLQSVNDRVESDQTRQQMDGVIDAIDDTCQEVRRIAHNMMPLALLKMGLDAAVGDMVDVIRESSDIEISYQNLMEETSLAEQQQLTIYRVINELVINAIKHGEADSVLVQLSRHNGTISLIVEDDGRGFDPSNEQPGLGLQSLHSRIKFLNGTYHIQSSEGIGTTVSIEMPASPDTSSKETETVGIT